MRIAKKAQQCNVALNKFYYNWSDVDMMLENKEVFYLDILDNPCYNPVSIDEYEEIEFRISTSDLTEISVELDNFATYANVATGKNGKKYYVSL